MDRDATDSAVHDHQEAQEAQEAQDQIRDRIRSAGNIGRALWTAAPQLRDHVTRAMRPPSQAAERAREGVKSATAKALEAGGSVPNHLRFAARRAHLTWAGEDPDEILQDSTFLSRYAQPDRVLPVQATQALLAAGLASGLVAGETLTMRSTRGFMDSDGGLVQELWRKVFPDGELGGVVGAGMDRIPGASTSGGMFHRIQHGHDLNALTAIMEEHGWAGAAEWFNHVGLRDFWTPHGVPFLPGGSAGLFDWLVDVGVKKTVAADMLTVNAAEMFAGIFYAKAVYSAWKMYRGIKNHQTATANWEEAAACDQDGNHERAIRVYERIYQAAGDDAAPRILVALAHLQAATDEPNEVKRRSRATRAHDAAMALLTMGSTATETVRLQGAQVSVLGLAGYVVASSASARSIPDSPGDFDESHLRTSVRAFAQTAERLGHWRMATPAKPYSAVINELLALELRYGLGPHAQLATPLALREEALTRLARLRGTEGNAERIAFIDRTRQGMASAFPLG